MAVFSNQATLTYNGASTNSNIAYGEILDVLTAAKTTIEGSYAPSERVTYVVTLRNTGPSALTGLTLTDDLGGYAVGQATVYPLAYEPDTAALYLNGAAAPAPTVTAGPPLTLTGLTLPAGANAVLVYQARANENADPSAGGTVTNTIQVTGEGLNAPVEASAATPVRTGPALGITKSINPTQVVDNARVQYTFVIQNTGNAAADAAGGAVITDTFDPRLRDLAVAFNGNAWTAGQQYTYNETSGLFATTAGQITVPAATYTQDPATGAYTITPGTATLTVTGTI